MRVSAIQLEISENQVPTARLDAACEAVRTESTRGAEVVVLPEMWLPGYFGFDQYESVAEPIDGATTSTLSELARDCEVTLVAGSLAERSAEGIHNTTLVLGRDGSRLASYRKMHLYGYGSREQELLVGGTEIVTFDLDGVGVGISTCYDLRFPELYRRMVDDGAEVFLVVAGWPFPRIDAWRILTRARAIENQAALVACNSAGRQGGAVFLGASIAVDVWGTCLGELDERPGVLRCELDVDAVRAARAEFPALADRVLKG